MARKPPIGTQYALFEPEPIRATTLAEMDAMGAEQARKALEYRDMGPGYEERATNAVFNALMMFGAAEILKRRGYRFG